MNENHKRHVRSTFEYVDNILTDAERVLFSSLPSSPFCKYWQDYTPGQRQEMLDHVELIRNTMRRILEDVGIPSSDPICGALWALRGYISYVAIVVAELAPRYMRGYGDLTDEDVRRLDAIVADMNANLDDFQTFLAHVGGQTAHDA